MGGRNFMAGRRHRNWLSERPVLIIVAHIHPGHRTAAVATAAGLTPPQSTRARSGGAEASDNFTYPQVLTIAPGTTR